MIQGVFKMIMFHAVDVTMNLVEYFVEEIKPRSPSAELLPVLNLKQGRL